MYEKCRETLPQTDDYRADGERRWQTKRRGSTRAEEISEPARVVKIEFAAANASPVEWRRKNSDFQSLSNAVWPVVTPP